MLTSSFLFTAGYSVMGEWLKQHAVALVIAAITGIGTYTGGQITNEARFGKLESDVDTISKSRNENIAKYVPMIENNDDEIRLLRRDYTQLSNIAAATAKLAQQNAGNVNILMEDRRLLTSLSTSMQDLTVDVGVMKNEVTHIKERVDRLK